MKRLKHSESLVRLITKHIDDCDIEYDSSGMYRTVLKGAEIGVHRGLNAAFLLDAVPHLNLTLVDPYDLEIASDYHRKQEDFEDILRQAKERLQPFEDRITWIRESSHLATKHIDDNSLDFVFIDATHQKDEVIRDILAWWPKVRVNGLVMGHDYNGRGDRGGRFSVKPGVDAVFGDGTVSTAPGLIWWIERDDRLL